MKPDFDTMTIVELRAYLLSHRNDDEAFYKLADRLEASPNGTALYPVPDTPENIALMEAAIREQVQKLEEKRKN
ncbi:MAG: hypothetical protein LH647_07500 [Leptolyngbyaceae cyanobacterium CAN_BIN12]|nr:hypothetical protein [Leptolyngbyaceae cyanobacterium CAN_BIN12]